MSSSHHTIYSDSVILSRKYIDELNFMPEGERNKPVITKKALAVYHTTISRIDIQRFYCTL